MSEQYPTDNQTRTDGPEADVDETQKQAGGAAKTLKYAVGFMLFMFGVGWASIPLYRIVCKSLDPGGSSWQNGSVDKYEGVEVNESRNVRVRFTASTQEKLPWEFRPMKPSVEVHPGEKKLVKFTSVNLDQTDAITGKAVYDINPPEAGQYFKKIECFCFIEQTLQPGEKKDMPLYFWFEPDMPDNIKRVTLGYTFFNADTSAKEPGKQAARR